MTIGVSKTECMHVARISSTRNVCPNSSVYNVNTLTRMPYKMATTSIPQNEWRRCQWRMNEFVDGDTRLVRTVQLVVLLIAFVMVSTVWSVSCLPFFYSWCPLCPVICKSGGGRVSPVPYGVGATGRCHPMYIKPRHSRAFRAVRGHIRSTGQWCTERARGTLWLCRCSTIVAGCRLCRTDDLRLHVHAVTSPGRKVNV